MTSDEERRDRNRAALAMPKPGDYWHEMFCPYFIIVNVDEMPGRYTVLSCIDEPSAKLDNGDGTWGFNPDVFKVVGHQWLLKKVTYGGDVASGFVADVVNSEKTKAIAADWRKHRARQLMKELKNLGSDVSEMLLTDE